MMELADYPDLLTVQDVCSILRIGRRSVYQYINDHTLQSKKIAGKYRIPKVSVTRFIQNISKNPCYNDNSDGSDALHPKKE